MAIIPFKLCSYALDEEILKLTKFVCKNEEICAYSVR